MTLSLREVVSSESPRPPGWWTRLSLAARGTLTLVSQLQAFKDNNNSMDAVAEKSI